MRQLTPAQSLTRYDINVAVYYGNCELEVSVDEVGKWVKWDDVQALLVPSTTSRKTGGTYVPLTEEEIERVRSAYKRHFETLPRYWHTSEYVMHAVERAPEGKGNWLDARKYWRFFRRADGGKETNG